jgi:hypothetical protein
MAFVRRKLSPDEWERLVALGIRSPWFEGPALFGTPSVDEERDALVVSLGGGSFEIPYFWALVLRGRVLVLQGQIMPGALPEGDGRLLVSVDSWDPPSAKDWPLWGDGDLFRILKDGLFQVITIGDSYEPGGILFTGGVGRRMEEA